MAHNGEAAASHRNGADRGGAHGGCDAEFQEAEVAFFGDASVYEE